MHVPAIEEQAESLLEPAFQFLALEGSRTGAPRWMLPAHALTVAGFVPGPLMLLRHDLRNDSPGRRNRTAVRRDDGDGRRPDLVVVVVFFRDRIANLMRTRPALFAMASRVPRRARRSGSDDRCRARYIELVGHCSEPGEGTSQGLPFSR